MIESFQSSLNVGYFGDDLKKLESKWNSEYFKSEKEPIKASECVLFNYELAPNQSSNRTSLVSKHCIACSIDQELKDKEFYSTKYYYHFNQ
jgi:hypothetical protein